MGIVGRMDNVAIVNYIKENSAGEGKRRKEKRKGVEKEEREGKS